MSNPNPNIKRTVIQLFDSRLETKVSPTSTISSLNLTKAELLDIIMYLDELFDLSLSSIEVKHLGCWSIEEFCGWVERRSVSG